MTENDRLKQYRENRFDVAIEPVIDSIYDEDFDFEFKLSITHNGYQWNVVSLTKPEMRRVIFELRKVLHEETKNAPEGR